MKTYWSISYKENGKEKKYGCFSKMQMIREYLQQLQRPFTDNISDLKIWKDDTDYTTTLNRFLSK